MCFAEVHVAGSWRIHREADVQSLASVQVFTDPRGGAQIGADIECDTFFPALAAERWRLWSQSAPKRDGDTRYAFQCWVPASASSTSGSDSSAPELPAGLAAQHEEYQVCCLSLLCPAGPQHADVSGCEHAHMMPHVA